MLVKCAKITYLDPQTDHGDVWNHIQGQGIKRFAERLT